MSPASTGDSAGGSTSYLLEIFAREIRVAMALIGVRAISEIDRSILA
jgi:isopentenyl diphosphate isomerase/L-lactate dehydrogenase-like FMN-dependent dehydrogenase